MSINFEEYKELRNYSEEEDYACNTYEDDSYDEINSVNEALMIVEDIDKKNLVDEKTFFDALIRCVEYSETEQMMMIKKFREIIKEEDNIINLLNLAERVTSSKVDGDTFKNYAKFMEKSTEVRDMLISIYVDDNLSSMISILYWNRFWKVVKEAYETKACLKSDGWLQLENISREISAYDCVLADIAKMILCNNI